MCDFALIIARRCYYTHTWLVVSGGVGVLSGPAIARTENQHTPEERMHIKLNHDSLTVNVLIVDCDVL